MGNSLRCPDEAGPVPDYFQKSNGEYAVTAKRSF